MQLSVVTTLYQSAPYVDEFYRRLRNEVEKITSDFEIVFVNDGSTDQSLDVALDFQKEDVRIRVIDLSRNFGHHKAIMTGASRDLSRLCN
jgi:putative glycosyltransferase